MFSLLKRSWVMQLLSLIILVILKFNAFPVAMYVVFGIIYLAAMLFAYIMYDMGEKIDEIHNNRGGYSQ